MFFSLRKEILIVVALFYMGVAYALPAVRLIGESPANVPLDKITGVIQREYNLEAYDGVRIRVVDDAKNQPDHLLVYLLPKNTHGLDIARINVDAKFNLLSCVKNYQLTQADEQAIEKSFPRGIECLDSDHEFVAFAPTNNAAKRQAAIDLAKTASADGFPGHSFYGDDADAATFISYLLCPQLKGVFFDGNGDNQAIIFVDREVTPDLLKRYVKEGLKNKVVNLWVADSSYDAFSSALIQDMRSQRYIGETGEAYKEASDAAAVCMLKNSMGGEAMSFAFAECLRPESNWEMGGNEQGSDFFGQ